MLSETDLDTFVCKHGDLFYWYVIIDSKTVMDQGVAKSRHGAQGMADRSKAFFTHELVGELV